jgi:hypothetical protein
MNKVNRIFLLEEVIDLRVKEGGIRWVD